MQRPSLGLWTVVVMGTALTTQAHAQTAQSGEFSVQRFEPAPGPDNFITVSGARVQGDMAWSAGLFANYAHKPFVIRSCVSETNCDDANALMGNDINVIKDLATADIMATLTPFNMLQIGLRVPLTFVKGDGLVPETGQPATGGLSGFGVGDPMLEGKFRFLGGPESPVVLGASLFGTGPVGHAAAKDKFIGYSSPVVGLRGIGDIRLGSLSIGANLAALYRDEAKLGSTALGPEFRYGAALGYSLSPAFRLIGEGYGGTKFSTKNGTNSMEGLLAAQLTPLQSGITFTAGGGAGVIQGVGVPVARGFIGLIYAHTAADGDGDGVTDNSDQCPTVPEDQDSFEDTDGCPDPDNDNDTIPDVKDRCPMKPETVNEWKDTDGCPDEVPDKDKDGISDHLDKCPDVGGDVIRVKGNFYGCPDTDKDGVPDKADACPDKPEDTDGYKDEDGCPDLDNDSDGVVDTEDQCVDEPGSKANNGCPETDKDKDGVVDRLDKCPDKPENYNGVRDDDGCPDGGSLITRTDTAIEIKGTINFATSSDKIVGNKSFQILDGVTALLVNTPSIQLIEIQGHTDNAGNADKNKELSQRRAEAVRAYMVSKGVSAERIEAKGYGQEVPIADNKKPDGRQKNRRVEFKIQRQSK